MQNRIFSMYNAKAIKAQGYGWLNAIQYMAPASMSGFNLCPKASDGCVQVCLGKESGQAAVVKYDDEINSVRASRIAKAQRFMRDRQAYLADVVVSIRKAITQAERQGLKLCVRLNGSTDISWEGIKVAETGLSLYDMFPDVQFVDYTKIKRRVINQAQGKGPKNLHLTFSRSEINEADCLEVLAAGGNVAVVFADRPQTWHGFPVVDGDTHDLRHLDPKGGYVIGLSPKGRKAKRDTSGFVVR